ncbi:MAG: ATP-binding protein [Spirochaetaceae bacterium]
MGWKHFQPLFDRVGEAVIVADPEEGRILYANRSAEELFGAAPGELVGLCQTELHPPERAEEVAEGFRRFAERMSEEIPVVREEIVRRDGTRLPVEIRSGTFVELGGQVVLYGIFRDVSAEHTAQEELEATRERLARIADAIPGVVYEFELSPGGRRKISKMSGGIHRLIGLSADEIEGDFETFRERVLPEDLSALETAIAASAASLSKFDHVFRIVPFDAPQEVRSLKAASMPDRRPDGTIVWSGVLLDVSDQAEAERIARESAEQKSRFIATLAHDLRTPLNVALGYTELLMEEAAEEKTTEQLRYVRQALRFQLELVQDASDLSRLEAGRVSIEKTPTSIRGLIAAISDLFRAKAEARRIELLSRVATDVPRYVFLDSRHVKQALMNLLSNAFKYTEHGRVEVSADYRGETLFLRVADSGPGIPRELESRLFEPFEHGDHEQSGSGLGLSIVREIASACGGTAEVERSDGSGTVFLLKLPAPAEGWVSSFHREKAEDMVAAWYRHAVSMDLPREIVDEAIDILIETGIGLGTAAVTLDTDGLQQALDELKEMAANLSMSEVEKLAEHGLSRLREEPPDLSGAFDIAREFESLAGELNAVTSSAVSAERLGDAVNLRAAAKVLLAEDNAANRKLFQAYLRRIGLEPLIAQTGREALDTLLSERVELAILDVNMPEMSGIEVVRRIRQGDAGLSTRFVAVTGYFYAASSPELQEFDAYLTKPIGEAEMRTVVAQWLDAG